MKPFIPAYLRSLLVASAVSFFPFPDVANASPDLAIAVKDFVDGRGQSFSMHGDAALEGGRIRLTRAVGVLSGSAIYAEPVELPRDKSFSAYFTFIMTPHGDADRPFADGITFIMHNDSKHVGEYGVGIGYRGISPSVVVEFDTFFNGAEGDPNNNHIGINLNGDTKSVATVAAPLPLANGSTRHAWIEYDGSAKRIDVRISDSAKRPTEVTLSHSIDLGAVLQDTANVGFTAGTGTYDQEHHIESFYFAGRYLRDGIDPPRE